jgi:phospho-N-acetylmuramoyl-pentapeptide-transferase
MLYYLFDYLDKLNVPGAGLFDFISFRAGMALIASLIVSIFFGKRIINALRRQQIGETVRDLGLAGQIEKSGTPTMGGIIILSAILIPTLLFLLEIPFIMNTTNQPLLLQQLLQVRKWLIHILLFTLL